MTREQELKVEAFKDAIEGAKSEANLASKQMDQYKRLIEGSRQIAINYGFSYEPGVYDEGYRDELKKYQEAWEKIHKLEDELDEFLCAVSPEHRQKKQDEQYKSLCSRMYNAKTSKDYADLATKFRAMNGYLDTAELAAQCDSKAKKIKIAEDAAVKAEEQRKADEAAQWAIKIAQEKERKYNALLKQKQTATTEKKFQDLAKEFASTYMHGYKKSNDLATECENRYQELKKIREIEEAKELSQRQAAEKRRKAMRAVAVVCAIFADIMFFPAAVAANTLRIGINMGGVLACVIFLLLPNTIIFISIFRKKTMPRLVFSFINIFVSFVFGAVALSNGGIPGLFYIIFNIASFIMVMIYTRDRLSWY